MRDYSKVSPQFWIGATGKALRSQGPHAQLVALYLLTNPHANMLGLYYLPKLFLSHETGLDMEGASKALARCIEAHFCLYDEVSEVVWVLEMAAYQIGDQLTHDDKRCKGVRNEFDSLPESPFLQGFFDRYADAFHMRETAKNEGSDPSPSEAPSKPRAGAGAGTGSGKRLRGSQSRSLSGSAVKGVFEHWKAEWRHETAKLDPKRKKRIEARLAEGFSESQLRDSISGFRNSQWHLGTDPRGNGTVYDSIETLLRDRGQVEKGLALFTHPPKQTKPESAMERIKRLNGGESHGRTIDVQPEAESSTALVPIRGNVRSGSS